MGKSRRAEHQKILAWLIEIALTQHADVIVMAGDIFGTCSPPSYAQELYNQFIVNLQTTDIHLIILGGNHDSTTTLGESKELLACLNTHVIPGVLASAHEQVILRSWQKMYDGSTSVVRHRNLSAGLSERFTVTYATHGRRFAVRGFKSAQSSKVQAHTLMTAAKETLQELTSADVFVRRLILENWRINAAYKAQTQHEIGTRRAEQTIADHQAITSEIESMKAKIKEAEKTSLKK